MAQKKKSSHKGIGNFILAAVAVIILTALVIGGGVFFITSKTYKQDKEALEENIEKLKRKVNIVEENLQEISQKNQEKIQQQTPPEPQNVTVKLFYYNIEKDRELNPALTCKTDAVLPLERILPLKPSIVQDTLELLFRGELTEQEKRGGFSSHFPASDFNLKAASLNNGTLTLEFDDSKNFVSGGACKAGVIKTQIEKTVRQFEPIKEVKFLPENLFD